jgi:heme-degrading monooxygenase HmoA
MMHIQVVTYSVEEVADADFIEANMEFADAMSAVPGLLAKIWLKGPGGGEYGGVYLWQDREAYERFTASDLWASVLTDDSISNIESRDYAVMDELTRTTQPRLTVV